MATKTMPEHFKTLEDAAKWIDENDQKNVTAYRYKYVNFRGWKVIKRGARA